MTGDKPVILSNFATCVPAPQKVRDRLIAAKEIGRGHIDAFMKKY